MLSNRKKRAPKLNKITINPQNLMAIDNLTIRKIASLAKLDIANNEIDQYQQDLSNILDLVTQMEICDTSNVEVMTHPMDAIMRFREDKVTEKNQCETLQSIAPATENGFYLVPKVID